MSRVDVPRVYPGDDPASIRRAIEGLQRYSAEIDTKVVSASYTVLSEDDLVFVVPLGSDITITLPYVDDAQRKSYYIKKTDTGLLGEAVVTVQGSGSETIDGGTVVLVSQYDTLHVIPQRQGDVAVGWHIVSFVRGTSRLIRSITITVGSISRSNLAFIGTTPAVPAAFSSTTAHYYRSNITMPLDWNKNEDVDIRYQIGPVFAETDGDEMSWTLDYIAMVKETTAKGPLKTSTQMTTDVTLTTAFGVAAGDIYDLVFTLDKDNSDNGWALGDKTVSIAFDLHLTNITDVQWVRVYGISLDYTALY